MMAVASRSWGGCVRCRKRRQKCGEQKPQCTRCEKNGETCTYEVPLRFGGRPFAQSRFGSCLSKMGPARGAQKIGMLARTPVSGLSEGNWHCLRWTTPGSKTNEPSKIRHRFLPRSSVRPLLDTCTNTFSVHYAGTYQTWICKIDFDRSAVRKCHSTSYSLSISPSTDFSDSYLRWRFRLLFGALQGDRTRAFVNPTTRVNIRNGRLSAETSSGDPGHNSGQLLLRTFDPRPRRCLVLHSFEQQNPPPILHVQCLQGASLSFLRTSRGMRIDTAHGTRKPGTSVCNSGFGGYPSDFLDVDYRKCFR